MKLKEFKQNKTLVALYVDSKGLANKKDINNCLYSIGVQRTAVDLVVFHNELSDTEVSELEGYLKDPTLSYLKTDEEGKSETVEQKLEGDKSINYTIVKTEFKNFSEIFNLGFNYADQNEYEFFSIVEQEDAFAVHWFEYAERYAAEEDKDVFLPLIRHTVNGVFQSMINEASWVDGMSEEAGITDINLLLRFNAINPLGGLYRVSSIKESSLQYELEEAEHDERRHEEGYYIPMKESMKLTHSYEFFLRMIYDDLKVRTVPRIGYELKVYSKDDFNEASSKIPQNLNQMSPENGGVSQNEIQFYIDLAKKEYFYEEDREVSFES